ncbi:MAG: IS110 family transposase [Anaerolineae bacterium]|nr:IS110 family transposase [Anaerolineae bacterium]
MSPKQPPPTRFIGLDVHKHYLIATGVDADLNQVYGPKRVQFAHLDAWIGGTLTPQDALVLEMTTNTFQLYDELRPYVHSVTVVHPPHVHLITRAQVMTDRIAAHVLATLLAKGLLVSIWVPSEEVRAQRALVAQRAKMVRLATQAKNRLHAVLHRCHILPPAEVELFGPQQRAWWLALELSPLQLARVRCDLDTLSFAQEQIRHLEESFKDLAAQDERVALLVQLPGIGLISALTLLAAIGDIQRFPDARHLVGYAGLGARVHDSGLSSRSGRITKAGRRDLRAVAVEAAQTAVRVHPHWQALFQRLEPRLGRNKAIVAVARKLLIAVWYVLSEGSADRFAEPELVGRKLLTLAEALGRARRNGASRAGFVRQHLDRLGLGAELDVVSRGRRDLALPPSMLTAS